jgi:hypothetical protein
MESTENGHLIIIPHGHGFLAFSLDTFKKAQALGQAIMGQPAGSPSVETGQHDEKILDAEQAQTLTGVPSSWFLEQARQEKIPYLRFGKYVRFKLSEVVASAEIRAGHKAKLSLDRENGKQKQGVLR